MIGGTKYQDLAQKGISFSDLTRYPLVMLERKSISRLSIDDFFGTLGITLSPVLELGSLDLVVSFVRNNMGLAFIPMELCGQFIDQVEVLSIKLTNPLPTRGIGLAEIKNAVHSHAAAQFKAKILAQPVYPPPSSLSK